VTPDGRHGPHVFVADLEHVELSEADRHHLHVLRTRDGDEITVCDGAGRWRSARFGDDVEPTGEIVTVARAAPPITIAFAPVKGDRPEWVVQKLTELGVDTIVPLVAERSVVVWPRDRVAHQLDRLRRISREAAMQSRQCYVPEVAVPVSFADAVTRAGVCLAHRGGSAPDLAHPTVLVGPEGGWSDSELALGLPRVGLGPGVLRAETAAVAAGVLLAALRAGLVHGHVG
jgi:16S rRNA (uracil1498-N3)-methyltransferase